MVGAIVVYCVVQKAMFSRYVLLDSSSSGFRNGFLLFFAGGVFSSFFLQAFIVLKPDKLDKNAAFAAFWLHHAKKALVKYGDFWYFGYDAVLTCGLLFTLLCFSTLPLLSLQSQLLFNRDFAKVIALKLRRADFLERILS